LFEVKPVIGTGIKAPVFVSVVSRGIRGLYRNDVHIQCLVVFLGWDPSKTLVFVMGDLVEGDLVEVVVGNQHLLVVASVHLADVYVMSDVKSGERNIL
jgi:hypothetical protein